MLQVLCNSDRNSNQTECKKLVTYLNSTFNFEGMEG